ncbi:hypothetical protein ONZ45_g8369 [Pleurotus djamor]|nr:hypothetical protein ONZ45_g8369 [Pleurotus djamor]
MPTPLPDEVLSEVFIRLSSVTTLKSLTYTSRRFQKIAEPVLFRDVVFTWPESLHPPTPSELYRYRLFCRKVAAEDGRLGSYVLSLQIELTRAEYFTEVFPFFINLRRLAIYLDPTHSGVHFKSTVRLTHLTWNATPICEDDLDYLEEYGKHLLAIVSSQPSLQYLKVHANIDSVIFTQLTSESLPCLGSLSCYASDAEILLPICKITTLVVEIAPDDSSRLASQSVTTLSYGHYNLPGPVFNISTHFPNLRQFIYRIVLMQIEYRQRRGLVLAICASPSRLPPTPQILSISAYKSTATSLMKYL